MNLLKSRRKLNNKGFTLIELLAVVVILAVVMGIAMTSVLSSMNNSRKGSLQNSAKSVAQAFQTKYSEALVISQVNDVFGDLSDVGSGKGYDFTGTGFYYLSESLKDELNISPSTYRLTSMTAKPDKIADSVLTTTGISDSFVYFDGSKFTVCMIAKQTGSYFVENAASEKTITLGGKTIKFVKGSDEGNTKVMWACSLDGEYSWKS